MNEVQLKVFEIYDLVAQICKANGLHFYALGGTLLGAVRHNGFIPWDDDIDIAIPRPEYNRFVSVVNRELPSGFVAKTYKDEKNCKTPTFICQIQNLNTRVNVSFAKKDREMPLWLDVFPLDAMPSNTILRNIHKYRLLYERMKIQFSMYEENVHQHREGRPAYEKALMKFREKTNFGAKWDTYDLMCHIEKTLRKYDFEKEDYFVNMFGAYKFKEMFPKVWFGEGIELPFEDTTIVCPVEYDKVLTQMYGDYMQLPPEEKRTQQHCMTIIELNN